MKTITEILEEVKTEICDNYCKMPFKYSAAEWEQMFATDSDKLPCNNCPLNKL